MENNNNNKIEIKIIKKKKDYQKEENNQKEINEIQSKQNEEIIQKEINEIKSKQNDVNSLILCHINGLEKYFENINSFPKLTYLNIKSSELKQDFELDLSKLFPNLTELYLYDTLINIINFPIKITKLYLIKNEFINREFIIIFNQILNTPELLNNLKELSFAKNSLSIIDLIELCDSQINNFTELELLDFRINKLTKFIYNPEKIEKLKIIDLSDNLFSMNPFITYKDLEIVSFLCGNTYLTELEDCEKYREELLVKLKNLTYPIKYLNLKGLTTKFNNELFKDIELNPIIQNSIIKLDLSYCYFNNECIFQFLLKNKFINLDSLNLTGGNIDDNFFKDFLRKKFNELYINLRSLNLSNNNIKLTNFQIVYLFIKENKKLSKLNICKNPFMKELGYTIKLKKSSPKIPELKIINDKIEITDFNSFITKLNKELIIESTERNEFNLKFDCDYKNNINSSSNTFITGETILIKKNI